MLDGVAGNTPGLMLRMGSIASPKVQAAAVPNPGPSDSKPVVSLRRQPIQQRLRRIICHICFRSTFQLSVIVCLILCSRNNRPNPLSAQHWLDGLGCVVGDAPASDGAGLLFSADETPDSVLTG